MRELPPELAALDHDDLVMQRATRDVMAAKLRIEERELEAGGLN